MNKKSYIYILLCLVGIQVSAQQFHSLKENRRLQAQSERNIVPLDTIQLPFFEDFSQNSVYPSSERWADKNIYVNRSFASEPPSIGVATFDIIDPKGDMYLTAGTNSALADKLTSLPIDLSTYDASDSIYLSFFYQPQGLGWDMPDKSDSLVLHVFNKDGVWNSVWNVEGSALQPFKQFIIQVLDTQYLHKGFRFMFANYASLGNPENQEDAIKNDFWNLDYILLNTNRTATDTTYKDVAFFESKERLFGKYRAIPWKHYKSSLLLKDTMNYHIRNLDAVFNAVDNMKYELKLNQSPLDNYDLGTINIPPNDVIRKDFSYLQMESSPGNSGSQIPSALNDSSSFEITQYYDAYSSDNSLFDVNDTLKFQFDCFNYYAFDDGTAELGLALVENNTKLAYKIEGLQSDTLRGLSILFNRYKDFGTADDAMFNICVWDKSGDLPGNIIYKQENIEVKYAWGIDNFAYFKLKEAVYVPDTFFVGFETANGKFYSIAYDINNHNEKQTFFYKNNWSEINIGTPMIRPHLGDNFRYISVPEIETPEFNLKVFPNPVKEVLHINISSDTDLPETLDMEIFNIQGQRIEKRRIYDANINISTQTWEQGIYLVKINSKKHSVYRKLIKI